MSENPDDKSETPQRQASEIPPCSSADLPAWIPRWLSERERAAAIGAVGLMLSTLILLTGVFVLLVMARIIR